MRHVERFRELNFWRKQSILGTYEPIVIRRFRLKLVCENECAGRAKAGMSQLTESSQIVRVFPDLYREGLNALPAHIAVIDATGLIVLVNRAWTDFARANGGNPAQGVAVGANYFDVCRDSATGDTEAAACARDAQEGLQAVLNGERSHFSLEYPCDSPTQQRWYLMEIAALDLEKRAGAIISHLDISARKQAELGLIASEARFRAMFDHAAVGIAEIAADGRWLRANTALLRIVGRTAEDLLSRTTREITHADDRDAEAAHFEVLRSGGADACTIEKRLLRADGDFVWTATSLSCVRASDNSVDYFLAVVEDISERKLAEDRQRTMMRELSHRGKNLLAVIQTIAHRSLTGDRPIREMREAFLGRVCALAATYGLLSDEGFEGAHLETVLRNELAPFGARARLAGPDVIMTVKAAQTFGLIVHELATNAAKYGALSASDGKLRVNWDITGVGGGRKLVFNWRESGGPRCAPPSRNGFGATILSRVAGSEFACSPQLDYAEEGLRYRFEAALERIGAAVAVTPVRRSLKSELICSFYDQWGRLRGTTGDLPQLAAFDWSKFASTGALTFAAIGPDGQVRFIEVGRSLSEELGNPLSEAVVVGGETEGMDEAYRRCARKAEPTHEFLRFDFGDGEPLTFERLLAPFCANGGQIATHVVGIAIFDGATRPLG
jgi:PAS domain S-box-containing protein